MKIRSSFVSNSSSSSFLLAFKGELDKEELIKAFKVPKDSPLYPLAEEAVSVFMNFDFQFGDVDNYIKEYLLGDQGYDCDFSEEDLCDEEKEALKTLREGYTICIGFACNENGGVEAAVCDMGIDYKSDNLIVKSGGGY